MTSGGNIFTDFPENKLAIDHLPFLCKPIWWNATLCWCHLGERRFPALPSNTPLGTAPGRLSSRTFSLAV